jgi:hypothetical protein
MIELLRNGYEIHFRKTLFGDIDSNKLDVHHSAKIIVERVMTH